MNLKSLLTNEQSIANMKSRDAQAVAHLRKNMVWQQRRKYVLLLL
jgi:hypothetical protein